MSSAMINEQIKAYLASGGTIKTMGNRKLDVMPWRASEVRGDKELKTGAHLSLTLNVTPEDFELIACQPGFPQAYSYKGETHWHAKNVIEWFQRNRRFKR